MAVTQSNEFTGEALLDRIQRNVGRLIDALKLVPFIFGGKLVSVHFVSGVQKNVYHGLGVPAAFIVVRQNYDPGLAAVRIGEFAPATQLLLDQRNVLAIGTDADCDLDLWFYPRSSKPIDSQTGQS